MTILAEIEAFLLETGMSASRFGALSVNDAGMMTRARAGRDIAEQRAAKIRAFMAAERANPSGPVTMGPKPRTSNTGICLDCGAKCDRKGLRCRPCSAIFRTGIARNKENRDKPCPADFVEIAATRNTHAICKHYGVGERTVKRWFAEKGIIRTRATRLFDPSKPPRPVKPVTVVASRKPAVSRVNWRKPKPAPLPDHRDNSRAGLAAQFLQRFGPVVRCNEDGRLNATGTHWLRGGRFVLTDDEIIARAERNGWRPDAWKAIAA